MHRRKHRASIFPNQLRLNAVQIHQSLADVGESPPAIGVLDKLIDHPRDVAGNVAQAIAVGSGGR